jgi:hypothetical protein
MRRQGQEIPPGIEDRSDNKNAKREMLCSRISVRRWKICTFMRVLRELISAVVEKFCFIFANVHSSFCLDCEARLQIMIPGI